MSDDRMSADRMSAEPARAARPLRSAVADGPGRDDPAGEVGS